MKNAIILFAAALLLISVLTSAALAQAITLPQAAHAANQTAGSYVDPVTGNTVWRLSDRTLCPDGAKHYYSYTNQFSINGDIVFNCLEKIGNTLFEYPTIYDANKKLLWKNARIPAKGPQGASFADWQWSQKRRVLYGISNNHLWELDPFSGKSTDLGAHPQPGSGALHVGPNDEILTYTPNNANGFIYFRPTPTSPYLTLAVNTLGLTNFDEANIAQSGRPYATYNKDPAASWGLDLLSSVVFDDNHGHMGFFKGSNGNTYVVKVKNDNLANGGVGQIGCYYGTTGKTVSPWRPEFGLYNDATGKREVIWGCDVLNSQLDREHFSRTTRALDVFGSTGSQSAALWMVNWTTGKVSKFGNIAQVHTSKSCGYWGFYARGALHPDATEILFDSPMADGTVLETNGTAKNCARGDKDVDVYVAATGYAGSATAGPDTTPPNVFGGLPSGALPAGTTSATLSVTTNEAATCRYSATAGTAYSSMTAFSTTGGTAHSRALTGLADGQSYNYYVKCQDASSNTNANDYAITFSVDRVTNFGRPASDVTTGWTGTATPHWSNLDEITASDSDHIRTGFAVGSQADEVKLSAVIDPGVDTGHVLRVRAETDATGNTLTYQLVQGTTVIASATHSLPNAPAWSTDTLTLTAAQASQITDYSDLRVRLSANAVNNRVFVSWIEFEVPTSSAAPTCSDGTAAGQCSLSKPKYCDSQLQLTDSCQQCGCPSGQNCDTTTGACTSAATACSDGTPVNTCVGTAGGPPRYCNSAGTIVSNCQQCACSGTDVCNSDGSCSPAQTQQTACSDGTAQNSCSITKPLYCNSQLQLVNSCSTNSCGCPAGQSCNATSQACYTPQTAQQNQTQNQTQQIRYNKLTFTGRLTKNTAQQTACSGCTIEIGLGAAKNQTATAADGAFTLTLYATVVPGAYSFDIRINDGTKDYFFRKAAVIS